MKRKNQKDIISLHKFYMANNMRILLDELLIKPGFKFDFASEEGKIPNFKELTGLIKAK